MAPSTRRIVEIRTKRNPPSATSPIRDVPLEVLSTIFVWAIIDSWHSSTSCSDDLLKFMLVCRQWRDAAQSSPTVWSTINVALVRTARATRGASRQARQLAAVETYLRRSGQVPLKISISGTELPPADEIMRRLVAHSFRWDTLNIKLTLVTTLITMPPTVRGNIPLLTTLTLSHNKSEGDYFTGREYDPTFVTFDDAPSLQNLEFISWPRPATLNLPWSQIRHISAQKVCSHDCIQLLKAAPNLASCEFTVRARDPWEARLAVTYPLPGEYIAEHLQSFTLKSEKESYCPHSLAEIMDVITFPSLEILEIHCTPNEHNPGWSDPELLEAILRSNCPLDRLKLVDVPLSEDVMVDIIGLLRSLRCLEIDLLNTHPSPLGIGFLSELVHSNNRNGVKNLPRLGHLRFSCFFEDGSEFDEFANGLESRRANNPHDQVSFLESVNLHLTDWGEYPDNFIARLRILALGGMRIQINGEDLRKMNSCEGEE